MMQQATSSTMFSAPPFDDGRGRFPDRISTKAPIGMRQRVQQAAQRAGVTSAAFIREAIETRLHQASASVGQEI